MDLKSISDIFNNDMFRIPDYQRGYSWGDDQLKDFWNDLENLTDGKYHYTGMLTVEKSSEANTKYIIDGQQRITTVIILIQVILNKFENKDFVVSGGKKSSLVEKYLYKEIDDNVFEVIFGYSIDNPSDCFYKKEILKLDKFAECSNLNYSHTLYTLNLINAKKFFESTVKDLEKSILKILFAKLTTQLKFNLYELDNELDRFVTFEVMNNRGKPLTTLELLKNRLIYLTTLTKGTTELKTKVRKDINESWKTIYAYLGKNPNKLINDDKFLADHWKMYHLFRYDRNGSNPEKKYLLGEYFSVKDLSKIKSLTEISDYVLDIQNAVMEYFYIENPEYPECKYNDEVKLWLSKLNRLGFDLFRPLLIASFMKYKEFPTELLKILKYIEKYMFIKFNTMKGSRTDKTLFYTLAKDLHKSENKVFTIFEVLRILEIEIDSNGKKALFKERDFYNLIDELFRNERKDGWYDWKGLKYLLYEYETKLQTTYRGVEKLKWAEITKINEETFEHIYPQDLTFNCWKEDQFSNYNIENNKQLLHSLGNILLLSKSDNSSLKNFCFEKKNSLFSNNSYSAIEVSRNQKWTPQTIKARGEKLLDFMSKRWNIEISRDLANKLLDISVTERI